LIEAHKEINIIFKVLVTKRFLKMARFNLLIIIEKISEYFLVAVNQKFATYVYTILLKVCTIMLIIDLTVRTGVVMNSSLKNSSIIIFIPLAHLMR
jgi:hypothetical protein